MPHTERFRKIDASLSDLLLLLDAELVRGRAQTGRLPELDEPAAHNSLRARAVFIARLAAGEAKLLEQVAEGANEMGLASFELSEIERRYPQAGARLIQKLQTLTRASSAVRRQDAMNLELITRARASVTGRLRALGGQPAAYTQRGPTQELPVFRTAERVV